MARIGMLSAMAVATTMACAAPSTAQSVETTPPTEGSSDLGYGPLVSTLTAELGEGPLGLFLGGDREILIGSLDLSSSVTLVPGRVFSAIYDPALDLLWYVRDHTLWVLDLRTASPGAVPIAEQVVHDINIRIRADWEHAPPPVRYLGYSPYVTLVLDWSDDPELVAGGDEDCCAIDIEAAAEAVLVGEDWLVEQVGRPAASARQVVGFDAGSVTLPAGSSCRVPECGESASLGRELRVAVVAEGEGGWLMCLAYDSSSSQFASLDVLADPAAVPWRSLEESLLAATPCADLYVAEEAAVYTANGRLCILGSDCHRLDRAELLGLLGAERVVRGP